jgi:hypothetical protein
MKKTYMQSTFEQGRPECERTMLHCQFTTADNGHAKVLLVLADQDMLHRSAELGHGQPVFMDTTFSIVWYKMSFLTLIPLDEEGRGEPLCGHFCQASSYACLSAGCTSGGTQSLLSLQSSGPAVS